MFNIILALMAGILIGWNFHSFFMALTPPKILRNDINISQPQRLELLKQPVKEKNVTLYKKTIQTIDINKTALKSIPISFYTLLNNNLFSDAMALYHDDNKKKRTLYRLTLESFFQDKIISNPNEAILQLEEYLAIEPDNKTTKLQLIEAYSSVKNYDQAIHLLIKLIDNSHSVIEQEKLNKKVIKISQVYIDELNKLHNFKQLIAFLEEHIEHGLNGSFYTFILAEHYVKREEYPLAIKLLKEIEFDEEYGEKAKELLKKIKTKEAEEKEYTHKFSLTKEGEHFLIDVTINETPLTLLLDTGASFTLIDEEKLSSLKLIEEGITLKTASGDIISKLQEAQSFKIEEIELKKFQLITTSFKERKADGLLGMNFFKKFKFKIDQEVGILYLEKK
jgi:predicted aspartyl protease